MSSILASSYCKFEFDNEHTAQIWKDVFLSNKQFNEKFKAHPKYNQIRADVELIETIGNKLANDLSRDLKRSIGFRWGAREGSLITELPFILPLVDLIPTEVEWIRFTAQQVMDGTSEATPQEVMSHLRNATGTMEKMAQRFKQSTTAVYAVLSAAIGSETRINAQSRRGIVGNFSRLHDLLYEAKNRSKAMEHRFHKIDKALYQISRLIDKIEDLRDKQYLTDYLTIRTQDFERSTLTSGVIITPEDKYNNTVNLILDKVKILQGQSSGLTY